MKKGGHEEPLASSAIKDLLLFLTSNNKAFMNMVCTYVPYKYVYASPAL
jgi:hypothetical protein